jgi:hypothetical protein
MIQTRNTMNPTLALFLRLTAIVAIAIVALVVAAFLLKIVIVAAIVAALIFGGLFVYNMFRKARYPVAKP